MFSPYVANSVPAGMTFPSGPGGPGDLGMGTEPIQAPAVSQASSFLGQPVAWYVGAILFWLAWRWLGEHESVNVNPAHLHIGGYNLVGVGLTWMVFWTTSKLIVNRWAGGTAIATYVNWLG